MRQSDLQRLSFCLKKVFAASFLWTDRRNGVDLHRQGAQRAPSPFS